MSSVTVLLVLASLLGSIYERLPETSYVKFIDVWVVWYLVNIFFICIFHIILDTFLIETEGQNQEKKTKKNEVDELFQTRKRWFRAIQQRRNPDQMEDNVTLPKKNAANWNHGAQIVFPIVTLLFNLIYFIRIVHA